ncbi:C4-dicarboxylate TRAP transporter substrate-binding protein [Pusillimonas noertemannii]|uniref:TRAP-type C4-dicarboxylate transport system substrate-binding protein n=1 Tax=Pusillimonas noertemannii TaxID=305977 RepID=A0A2U1CSU0_9BURK|nr:C4-dicarboxylate TRAP transporter substrate-binding protein [Pusillimonas noertemannii]NYT70523.1 C4-dicarboxylate TRAP transporter substrate-binding protein [Pusillimonas noertemannii]PVY68966.1 TRAP-type C4-dicarboxylate transport system substrate-binding protein [Pusillimonas noertemannii]TFL11592.1 C4-dicarboxylate ABC transporter substrate-binding protein [Pusillimonas noertemannii]
MISRRTFNTAALLSLAGAAMPALGQKKTPKKLRVTVASGHPPVFLWVKLLDDFLIPEIDRRLEAAGGDYQIEWTKAWGGTLIKLGAESKGIADGIADIGYVSTIFEAPNFPLQNISYHLPFTTSDIGIITNIMDKLQEDIPAVGDAWTKNGLVYLGSSALDSYQLFTNFSFESVDDLKGKKIAIPGPTGNWFHGTGSVGVPGTLNTYYEDIKSGVSQGVPIFATGGWGAKVFEVAPHLTLTNFGSQYAGGIAFGKRRFEKLPPEVQAIFKEVGSEYSRRFTKAQTDATAEVIRKMKEAGTQVKELPEAERVRWANLLPSTGTSWAKEMEAKGLPGNKVLEGFMAELKRAGVNVPRDWANT